MSGLDDFRQQNPAYKDVPDDKLAEGLYNKFYASRMSRDDFNKKLGISAAPQQPQKEMQKQTQNVAPEGPQTPIEGHLQNLATLANVGSNVIGKVSDLAESSVGKIYQKTMENFPKAESLAEKGVEKITGFLQSVADNPIMKAGLDAAKQGALAYNTWASKPENKRWANDLQAGVDIGKFIANFTAAKGTYGMGKDLIKGGIGLAGKAVEKTAQAVAPEYLAKRAAAQIPMSEQIRNAGSQKFAESAKLGGQFHPLLTSETVADIQDHMAKPIAGILTSEGKEFNKGLKELKWKHGTGFSLADVKNLDETLGDRVEIDPNTYKLTKNGQKYFDLQSNLRKRFYDAPDRHILGPTGGIKALQEGKKLWSASYALDDIERLQAKAARTADPAKAEKALFGQLADNRKRMNLYTKEERNLIKKIAKGSITATILRETLGNRATSMIVGELGLGGLGGATAGAGASAIARGAAGALEAGPKAALRKSIIERSGINQ